MSVEATDLTRTVSAMRPVIPARDFDVSKRFYVDLGFQTRPLADRLVEMQLGAFSFILQDHYVREWADNFVMHLPPVRDVSYQPSRQTPSTSCPTTIVLCSPSRGGLRGALVVTPFCTAAGL
jgi:hypothetical protein